jgi:Protein export membrane protein
MTVGIIVGTYSSVYVASPFALLWEKYFGAGGKLTNKSGSAPVSRSDSGRPAANRDDAAGTGTGEQPLPRPRPRPRQTRRRA